MSKRRFPRLDENSTRTNDRSSPSVIFTALTLEPFETASSRPGIAPDYARVSLT
jgi:hypothetical protein